FTPSTHSQSCCVCSQIKPPLATPALFTTTCGAPKCFTHRSASACTSCARETSAFIATTFAEVWLSSATALSSASCWMSASTRFRPFWAPRRASSRPKPLPAPVITAVVPGLRTSLFVIVLCSCSDQLDQLFAKIAALEKTEEGLRCAFDALLHRFAELELALREHRAQFLGGIGPDFRVLADDEALDPQAVRQDQRRVVQGQRLPVVAGDHPAHGDAPRSVHAQQHGIQDHAADVFKVAIDAIGRDLFERLIESARLRMRLVVDAGIEAQLIDHIAALVRATRQAHHAAAMRSLGSAAI